MHSGHLHALISQRHQDRYPGPGVKHYRYGSSGFYHSLLYSDAGIHFYQLHGNAHLFPPAGQHRLGPDPKRANRKKNGAIQMTLYCISDGGCSVGFHWISHRVFQF